MIKILLVDDYELVRAGLRKLIEERHSAAVFGEAGSTKEALSQLPDRWDVIVLDIAIAGGSGLEFLKEVKHSHPGTPVLVMTAQSQEQFARRAFSAGAAGYVTKDRPGEELASAVFKVAAGGRYVSSAVAERLVAGLANADDLPVHETLSDREFEVMRLIASGKTVGQIAQILYLSDKTISTYRARILRKMAMSTNAELTHYAIQKKLVE